MRIARCVLLIVMACLAHVTRAGHQSPLTVGVYEDLSGQVTLSKVMHMAFEPAATTIARGYSGSAFWLRIVIAPHRQAQFLRVRPSYLDDVSLYVSVDSSGADWHVMNSGDRVPMFDRPVWTTSLMFPIAASSSSQTVYLRLKTTSSSLLNISLLGDRAVHQQELLTALGQILTIAIMAALLIWAAIDYWVGRQRVVGIFVFVQISQIAFVLAISGFMPLMWPRMPYADLLTSLIVATTILVTLLFHRVLVQEFAPSRLAILGMNALVTSAFLAILLVVAGQAQVAMKIGSLSVLLLIPMLLWLAISAKRDVLPGLTTLRVTYGCLAVILAFVMLPILGFSVSFDFYVWATSIQGLLSGLVMAAFLFKRSLAFRRQQLNSRIELAQVQQNLRTEQQRVEDQRQFLDMLAHELKTPLGVIRLTLESVELTDTKQRRLNRSLQTMSALIDRCRLSLQMEEGKLQPHMEVVEVQQEVMDSIHLFDDASRVTVTFAQGTEIQTDRQLLSVIIHNLIDNALKYALANSPVDVSCHRCVVAGHDGVEMVVANQIEAKPAPDAEQLFQKYFRGKGSTGVTGSGLGLSLARGLAKILGGELDAQFDGDRLEVRLWLPA